MMASPRLRSSIGESSADDAAPMEGSPTGWAWAASGRACKTSAALSAALTPCFAIEQMEDMFLRFISL